MIAAINAIIDCMMLALSERRTDRVSRALLRRGAYRTFE